MFPLAAQGENVSLGRGGGWWGGRVADWLLHPASETVYLCWVKTGTLVILSAKGMVGKKDKGF